MVTKVLFETCSFVLILADSQELSCEYSQSCKIVSSVHCQNLGLYVKLEVVLDSIQNTFLKEIYSVNFGWTSIALSFLDVLKPRKDDMSSCGFVAFAV